MRSKQGTVISDANDKTIVVKVDREVRHPIYKKNYRVTKKFHAHDEKNEAQVGDVVSIVESKPISKNKTWKLENIISKNAKVVDQPAAVESESEKELQEVAGREKEAPVEKPVKKEAGASDTEHSQAPKGSLRDRLGNENVSDSDEEKKPKEVKKEKEAEDDSNTKK